MDALNLLFIVLCIPLVCSQNLFDCPLGWEEFEQRCYHFVFYPTRVYGEATQACEVDGAFLLSVNSKQEHEFVSSWLTRYDINRNNRWWTSGIGANEDLRWEGDGTSLLQAEEYWIEPGDRDLANKHVVYKYSTPGTRFAWGRESADVSLPFICEISLNEAYRIIQAARDHSYGTTATDLNDIVKGPKFSITPSDLVVVGTTLDAFIECAASGHPLPTYRWMKKDTEGAWRQVTSQTSSRYTLTNGKLTFVNPSATQDVGDFQCAAENEKGIILSDPIQVSFGYLYEFSNDPPGAVRAPLYQGTVVSCNPPNFNPVLRYQWFKDSAAHFVRPNLNQYMFISNNGKLYFSETQQSDAGAYHCVVTLTAPLGQTVATTQPPSRTSLGIQLIVVGETANDFGPTIHNDFPAVFPSPPIRGEDIRLECLAYGRLPLYYSWTRDDAPMAGNVRYSDLNRVMVIPNAAVEDSGNYTCHVKRGSSSSDSKSFYLNIEAKPYFIFPLRDQHLDIGSQLTWRCEVIGRPRAQYSWYKNGQLITSVPGDVEVNKNVLVITSAQPSKHNGMYQCAAENLHGSTYSSAELRVLEFAPTFAKHPVDPSQLATVGGNATVICQPEAAPKPEITWKKDGRSLGLSTGVAGHLQLLANGNLLITDVTGSDAGHYECTATNDKGSASSGGKLEVVERTTLSISPSGTRVVQNNTAFLFCQASFNRRAHDLVYIWYFNNVMIDTDKDPHFSMGRREMGPGIYIKNAQFKHHGVYTCNAQTVQDKASLSAVLTVLGPPGEPAGVFAEITGRLATVTWTIGTTHGMPVTSFAVQFRTDYRPEWRVILDGIPNEVAVDSTYPDRRFAQLGSLRPGSSYNFRVIASNMYGSGIPSVHSSTYKIPNAAPVVAPQDVGGGGGTVGALKVTWEPLHLEDFNGDDLGYMIYFRKQTDSGGLWQKGSVEGHLGEWVTTVGGENYYLEYEVMVAAFNSLGQGPNSTINIVLSAEDMPTATPTNLNGDSYNGTAIMVTWDPVPDTRQAMKGRVQGYQINYYLEGEEDPILNSISHYGQLDGGLVIGLQPDGDYWVNVQVFNTAGLGPRGEEYRISTFTSAPLLFPRYVEIHSHSSDSVYVAWQGVSTGLAEETLLGYKMRYWEASENILTAKDAETLGKETHGIIRGVKKGIIYRLRVLAYNWGGDGKKSPPVFFTLEGQVRYDPTTSIIKASGSRVLPSIACLVLSAVSLINWN
ncbi:contactin-like [Haliotis rufescens]|uniref:contactin-like n=1 Tax=Haliotis rufescens TaxID=6454 RepID=UPI00201EC13C|nr:contactin-like [Haliotis rufescens]XP_046331635.2 contactin-like [Haliotis rufescens]